MRAHKNSQSLNSLPASLGFIDPGGDGGYYETMSDSFKSVLGPDDEGRRLDRILRIAFKAIPLSAIHKSLRKGNIRVNGMKKSPDYRCRSGDLIEGTLYSSQVSISRLSPDETPLSAIRPLAPPLLLLETKDLLFLNKPLGMLVHDGKESLEAVVKEYLTGKIKESLAFSPGPLHRLDRNTSGIITFPRSIAGARDFSAALKSGDIEKTYLAVLTGRMSRPAQWRDTMARNRTTHKSYVNSLPQGEEDFRDEIGEAVTNVVPLLVNDSATLAAIILETGRTHQIRAQAAHHGHSLVGDTKYGGNKSNCPYYLHAWKLGFRKKFFSDLPDMISAPVPDYFQETVESIFAVEANEVYSVLRQFRS